MIERAVSASNEGYVYFPGVTPQWDNEARKPNRGVCFVGSTPRKYGAWLEQACEQALAAPSPDERIVFINAWNEWAEGAYLEPDRHYGYAYLAETARTLDRMAASAAK
jgi:lipopolysaccharide biosynthesis protein